MSVHIANEHELKVARHMLSDLKRNDPFGLAAQGEWQRQIHVFDEAVGVILHVTGAIKAAVPHSISVAAAQGVAVLAHASAQIEERTDALLLHETIKFLEHKLICWHMRGRQKIPAVDVNQAL